MVTQPKAFPYGKAPALRWRVRRSRKAEAKRPDAAQELWVCQQQCCRGQKRGNAGRKTAICQKIHQGKEMASCETDRRSFAEKRLHRKDICGMTFLRNIRFVSEGSWPLIVLFWIFIVRRRVLRLNLMAISMNRKPRRRTIPREAGSFSNTVSGFCVLPMMILIQCLKAFAN